MRWLGGVRSDQQVEIALAKDLDHWSTYGFGRWILRSGHETVGQAKLAHWRSPNGDDEVEVGYALIPSAWGLGLATEAARGALARAAEQELASSIVAFALVGNDQSFRVMSRLGFDHESDFHSTGGASRLFRRRLGKTP